MAAGDLITQDYEVEYQGLLMGGSTAYGIIGIDGLLDLPDVDSGDRQRLRRHGLHAGDDFMGGRSVTVELDIFDTSTLSATLDALTEATAPGSDEAFLVFQLPGVAGGSKAGIWARPRKRKLPIGEEFYYGIPEAAVEFFATDPRIYSAVSNSEVVGLPSGGPGASFNFTFNLSFGGVSESGTIYLTNDGTFSTPWTARIDGPVTNPSIENVLTGDTLSFNIVVASGDYLLLNSDDRSVLLNGTASRYSSLDAGSSWWELEPGSNEVKFRASTTTAATLTLTWRDAWV